MPKSTKTHVAARVDEHVACVLVAVEKTVIKHGLKKARGGVGQNLRQIMAGGAQLIALVDVDAVDPRHDQHALAGQIPKRRRSYSSHRAL